MTPNVEATLTKNLPVYMVPSVLFTVQALPTTPTGKTDRRRLREMAAQFSTEQLAEAQTAGLPKRQPTCEAEHLMQSLWARILNLQADIIGLDDSFLRLGGDSISAMRLVNEARKDGFHLSVADVFHRDTLSEMVARQHPGRGAMTHPASESSEVMLIDDAKKEKLLQQIDALDLDMRSEDVADILPVTRMQERYFDKSTYMPSCAGHNDRTLCGRYANYFYLDLSASTDVSRLEAACAQGLTRFPILRACFLRLQGKLWQVVLHKLKRPLRVQELDNDRTSLDEAFHSFCIADAHQGSEVEPPVALVLLKHKLHDMRLVIRISHAQYDGICFPIVVEALVKGWDPATPAPPDFSAFLLDAERRRPQSIAYWKEVLRGSLPTGLLKQIAPYADSTEKRQQLEAIHLEACVTIPSRLPNKISTATLASAAWALLLSRLSGQDEVVFGRTVAGRNTAIQDIDRVVGCCINFIPVRVSLSSFQTAAQLLQGVQDQFLAVGDADSLSYQEILENCTGWPAGSKFESTIVHQNFNEDLEIELGGATSRVQFFDNPHTMPQWIYLITRTKGDQLHLELFSNTHITSQETAHAMMDDYSHIITSFNGSVDNLPLT